MPEFGLNRLRGCGVTRQALLRTVFLWLLMPLLWGLAGCAQLPSLPARQADAGHWSGRLALQVEDQATQSFSASFELQGSPARGELVLLSPLGNVLARLQWEPGSATLASGNETQTADSLDALLRQSTGTHLPITALFDWLNGTLANADGWQADLSSLDQGRLTATRHTPAPLATLRIALDR